MKNISTPLVLLAFILLTPYCFAQTLKGKITDKQSFPIEDAYVYVLNKNVHSHTNDKGFFTLEGVEVGDSLQVSHTSYKKYTQVITKITNNIKIQLEEQIFDLSEVVIPKKLNALKIFSDINLEITPVNNSQDILKTVPGLIIGQHAGGGKAEQIFLRGFDIDHGTDIRIDVEGLPVNMVSHAHGQGYADLHFVIPETIEKIDFDKGPYDANKGNFATAGYVNFKLKEKVENSSIKLEAGNFNTQRLTGLFNLYNQDGTSAYVATEYSLTDGPYKSPQNFHRANVLARFTNYLDNGDKVGALASYFTSAWDASGQIPVRAIPTIGWFGAIDDTEGGTTSRSNFMVDYTKRIDENSFIENKAFYARYGFELYSNFTFFNEFPVKGDQIRQKEEREIFGLKSEFNKNYFKSNNQRINLKVGVELRNDKSQNNELSWTQNRQFVHQPVKLGNIDETNLGGYINTEFKFNKWVINPGIRLDYFKFNYYDKLQTTYETKSISKYKVSPKLNFLYNYSNNLQLFLKTGKGFHSNDTRSNVDEQFKANNNIRAIMPSAYGSDIGFIWKPVPKLMVTSALWYLFLEEEIAYIGDGGEPEVSGKTVRKGVDFSVIYHPTTWLSFNADANYANPRATSEQKGQDYVPLAPTFTFQGGARVNHPSGFFGGLRVLHLADRAANEDNSIVAEGYTITDLNVGYKWNKFTIGLEARNLFNTKWKETQFATESRLQGEADSVEEIHFTPGLPFNFKASLTYTF